MLQIWVMQIFARPKKNARAKDQVYQFQRAQIQVPDSMLVHKIQTFSASWVIKNPADFVPVRQKYPDL